MTHRIIIHKKTFTFYSAAPALNLLCNVKFASKTDLTGHGSGGSRTSQMAGGGGGNFEMAAKTFYLAKNFPKSE